MMEVYNVIDGDSLNVVLQKEDIYFNDSWVFWYDDSPPKGIKQVDYESAIKELGTFSTVQEFWRLWTNLNELKTLPDYSNLRLFRKGVKPMWEDPANTNGGKWVIPAATIAEAERLWAIVIIAAIGEQFDEDITLTGIVLSLRPKESVLQLWTKTAVEDPVRQTVLANALHQKMDLHHDVDIIFQVHFASLEFTRNFVKKPRSNSRKGRRSSRKLNYDGSDDSDPSHSRGTTPTNWEEEGVDEDLPFFIPILDHIPEDKPHTPSPEQSPRHTTGSPQLSIPRSNSSTTPLSHRSNDGSSLPSSSRAITGSPTNPTSRCSSSTSGPNQHSPRQPLSTTPPPKIVSHSPLPPRPDSRGFNGASSPTPARYSPQELSPQKFGTPPSPVKQTRRRSQSYHEASSIPSIPFAPVRPLTPNPPPPAKRSITPSFGASSNNNPAIYHPPIPRSPPRTSSPLLPTMQQQATPTSPTRPPSRFAKSSSPMIPFGVNNGSNSRPPSRASPFPGSPSHNNYRPPSRSSSTSPSFHNRQLHQTQVAELLKRVSKATEAPLPAYIDVKDDSNAMSLISQLVSMSLRKKRGSSLGLNAPTPTRSSPAASSPSSPLDSPNPPSSPRLMPQFISSGSSAFVKKSQDSPPTLLTDRIT